MRWMKLEPIIIQSEVSQKEKHQYSILTLYVCNLYGIYMGFIKTVMTTLSARHQKKHMYPNVHCSAVCSSQGMEVT